MSLFVIIYFIALVAASCLAAYYKQRSAFVLLFSLTLISFVLGIVGGAGALRFVAISAGLLAFAAGVSYCFREFLVVIAPTALGKELKTAPLTAAFGMFIIFTYAIAGIFAPWIAPFGESEVIASAFAPADDTMLLGADQLGRDMFSRIIYGARNTVGLALSATLAAFFMGAFAGLLAATRGGWLDQVLGRAADVIMAIPSLIFALLMLSIFGPQVFVIIVAVAIIYAPRVFRLTRAVAGNVVVMDYIEAAKLRGEKTGYLIRKEILPNATAPLVAEFGLEFCFVFLLVAGLSFLGLGIQPPTADWGSMVRENATLISFGEITPLIPAAAIALLTVAVNFVVDWMLFRSSGLKE
ncbi:ABC transporter permease [Mesobacterium pallidum]|uniref:ABC transporter permease n=1 Tax=Mesobacterium pallidum TaxID=2872037 RepID=UPI001EE1FD8A|nr:ABC transporter permease [Mesobacterium pallidum]